jgi:hypothetical protein
MENLIKETWMVTFIFGLSIGALMGFLFCAVFKAGKNADEHLYQKIVVVDQEPVLKKAAQEA